jgi:ABC-type transport system involved in multi-copper enzyme maturation permease subunit
VNGVPSTASAVLTIARVTLLRMSRGKLIWVALCISLLPVLLALALPDKNDETIFGVQMLVLGVLPPMFVASSIGEEIEERTATYLWSRPLPRWTILAGKLVALVPLVIFVVVGAYVVAVELALHIVPYKGMAALALGALATSVVAAGIATLVPKHGMSLSIIFLLFIDLPVGEIPASVRLISVTHDAASLGGANTETPASTAAIALAVISALWLALAFRRIGRLET